MAQTFQQQAVLHAAASEDNLAEAGFFRKVLGEFAHTADEMEVKSQCCPAGGFAIS